MQGVQGSFLEEAGRHVYARSPSTSAYLISERLALSRLSKEHQQMKHSDLCQRCGTLALGAWKMRPIASGLLRDESVASASAARNRRQTAIRKCCRCGNVSSIQVDSPHKPSRSRSMQQRTVELQQAEEPAQRRTRSPTRQETKVSSKKRAKRRKDFQGIQALVSRASAKSSHTALDLMDLMKR
jgi:endogenous inhibitor of DNA gyrase (YacG/DUF329 family)